MCSFSAKIQKGVDIISLTESEDIKFIFKCKYAFCHMYETVLVQLMLRLILLFLYATLKLFHYLVEVKVVFRYLYGFCCFQAALFHVEFPSREILNVSVRVGELAF